MFSAGFSDVDATLVSAGGGLELQGTVRVESFDVRDDALRARVLAPAFLDAERHPELAFRSTAIRTDRDELRVSGELTIKGTTRTRDQVTDAIATGVPDHAADSARDTLGGAVGAADRLPTGLLAASREAFTDRLHMAAAVGACEPHGGSGDRAATCRNRPCGPRRTRTRIEAPARLPGSPSRSSRKHEPARIRPRA
jgi:hypothetical protein